MLSASEIDAVLCLNEKFEISENILMADTDADGALINSLGGTIKIGLEVAKNLSEEEMINKMVEQLKTTAGKIHFGLSFYGPSGLAPKQCGLRIKNILKNDGFSTRYVENKTPALSSVTVAINNLTKRGAEFLIIKKGAKFSLAKTIAVQPFEEFSRRDYGRPGRDDKSGMLPPKLAMMMINLAVAPKDGVLLDPFCGSGTILTEALLLGYDNVIGSDISDKAVADTQKNIEWTKSAIPPTYVGRIQNIKLFQSDIADIDKHLAPNSINAIITEPYLGKPLRGNESADFVKKQASELKALYLAAFKQFNKLLKKDGAVVFIIPRFQTKNDWVKIDCLEEIKKIPAQGGSASGGGFQPLPFFNKQNFLLYHRPGQRVAREIWRFIKR